MTTKIKKGAEVFYIDHHGKPKNTFCTGSKVQGNWTMYELRGVPSYKFEDEVFASKDDLINSIKKQLERL